MLHVKTRGANVIVALIKLTEEVESGSGKEARRMTLVIEGVPEPHLVRMKLADAGMGVTLTRVRTSHLQSEGCKPFVLWMRSVGCRSESASKSFRAAVQKVNNSTTLLNHIVTAAIGRRAARNASFRIG